MKQVPGTATGWVLLAIVLGAGGCSREAPSCAASFDGKLNGFAETLESAGVVRSYEIIDDCGSDGSRYANLVLLDLESIREVENLPDWSCTSLPSAELDAPLNAFGYRCEVNSREIEISNGMVNEESRGQLWLYEEVNGDS